MDSVSSQEHEAGGRAVWEDTAEKREASLRERKAQMILAARQYVPSSFLVSYPKLTLFDSHRRMLAAQRIPPKSPTA